MDFITLDANFRPDKLVEKYSSLNWAERFYDVGEFELVSYDVEGVLRLLPMNTCVSLLDSKHIMRVDTHEIDKSPDEPDKIIVRGQALDGILEDRAYESTVPAFPGHPNPPVPYTNPRSFGSYIDFILRRGFSNSFMANLDQLPNGLNIIIHPAFFGPDMSFEEPKPGVIGDILRPIVKANYGGFIMTRPDSSGNQATLHVKVGEDLSATKPLRFDLGHLEDSKYFYSVRGSKNVIYTWDDNAFFAANWHDEDFGNTDATGVSRRVGQLDASGSDTGDYNPSSPTYWGNIIKQMGYAELATKIPSELIEASVSADFPYIYGQDYDLGDYTTLAWDYSLGSMVQYTEYIRSIGEDGVEISRPTLAAYGR